MSPTSTVILGNEGALEPLNLTPLFTVYFATCIETIHILIKIKGHNISNYFKLFT